MSLSINIKIIQNEDVVVIRGLEFPNVIVQGKDEAEAKSNFIDALEYFMGVRKKIEIEKYPVGNNEKVESIKMEFVTNGSV